MGTDPSVTPRVSFDASIESRKRLTDDKKILGLSNRVNNGFGGQDVGNIRVSIDPDEPIPYVLTDLGHLEVAAARVREEQAACVHRWAVRRGYLLCQTCAYEATLSAGPRSWSDKHS